jgi:hypothetical protein
MCFVSAEYFRGESRFADFVVHEVAHTSHNCKRRTIGQSEVRHRDGSSTSTSMGRRPPPTRAKRTAVSWS